MQIWENKMATTNTFGWYQVWKAYVKPRLREMGSRFSSLFGLYSFICMVAYVVVFLLTYSAAQTRGNVTEAADLMNALFLTICVFVGVGGSVLAFIVFIALSIAGLTRKWADKIFSFQPREIDCLKLDVDAKLSLTREEINSIEQELCQTSIALRCLRSRNRTMRRQLKMYASHRQHHSFTLLHK